MDAWLGLLAFTTTLVVVLIVVRLGSRRSPVVVNPVIARASAFRERSRHPAYLPLRDPAAPGCRRRPRAPSSTPL